MNPAPMRFAVIPTHSRPVDLLTCVRVISDQCSVIIVIDNASDPPVELGRLQHAAGGSDVRLFRDEEQPPNLSRLWNCGLVLAERIAIAESASRWDVAVLNDDAIVPPGWFDAVAGAMRAGPAVAACADPYGYHRAPVRKTAPDRDITTRMAGWAFILRGEHGLRFDEAMRWWWSDTDLDWRARQAGGMLIVPGYSVANTHANESTTGELAEQAGRDRLVFKEKWGFCPW